MRVGSLFSGIGGADGICSLIAGQYLDRQVSKEVLVPLQDAMGQFRRAAEDAQIWGCVELAGKNESRAQKLADMLIEVSKDHARASIFAKTLSGGNRYEKYLLGKKLRTDAMITVVWLSALVFQDHQTPSVHSFLCLKSGEVASIASSASGALSCNDLDPDASDDATSRVLDSVAVASSCKSLSRNSGDASTLSTLFAGTLLMVSVRRFDRALSITMPTSWRFGLISLSFRVRIWAAFGQLFALVSNLSCSASLTSSSSN